MARTFTLTSDEVQKALALYVGEKEGLGGEYTVSVSLQLLDSRIQSATVDFAECPTYPPMLRVVKGSVSDDAG